MPQYRHKRALAILGLWCLTASVLLAVPAHAATSAVTALSSTAAFDTAVGSGDNGLVLVEFTADWCAPCRKVAPIISTIAEKNPHVRVYSVDVDRNSDLTAREGIRGIPYVAFYRQGRMVYDLVGLHSEHRYQQAVRLFGDAMAVAEEIRYTDVSAAEARQLIASDNPLILDVRTPREYQSGHIPGAVLIPVQRLAERIGEITPHVGRKVLIYCRSGNRSVVAAKILHQAGFRDVINLRHGILEWQAAGYPLTTPG